MSDREAQSKQDKIYFKEKKLNDAELQRNRRNSRSPTLEPENPPETSAPIAPRARLPGDADGRDHGRKATGVRELHDHRRRVGARGAAVTTAAAGARSRSRRAPAPLAARTTGTRALLLLVQPAPRHEAFRESCSSSAATATAGLRDRLGIRVELEHGDETLLLASQWHQRLAGNNRG